VLLLAFFHENNILKYFSRYFSCIVAAETCIAVSTYVDKSSYYLLLCCKGHRRTGSHGNVVATTVLAAVSTAVGSDVVLPTVTTARGSLEDVRLLSPKHNIGSTPRSKSWAYGMQPQGTILHLIVLLV